MYDICINFTTIIGIIIGALIPIFFSNNKEINNNKLGEEIENQMQIIYGIFIGGLIGCIFGKKILFNFLNNIIYIILYLFIIK